MIFADTSFWIAGAHVRDARHKEAALLLRQHRDDQIVTSNHVVGETWTFLRRRAGHAIASGWLDFIEASPRVSRSFVSPELEQTAWGWLRKHNERAYSFVDATSFALMRSMKIREALAFDGDFTAAGFTELRV